MKMDFNIKHISIPLLYRENPLHLAWLTVIHH